MAGQKFQYDESGSTFLYFVISFLGLVLVPSTFYFGPSDKPQINDSFEDKRTCHCPGCRLKVLRLKKPERWKSIKKNIQRFFLLIGWCFLAYLIYKVQEFDYEYANFDPYDILGVGLHASSAEIKKAYRKLSLIYHPDKSTGNEKKFMKLNKAYEALTDDVARRNYELYGNPDGPGAMNFGIALPSWIIEKENSIWVLGVYAFIFMIILPTAVAVWWSRSTKFTSEQVLLDTTQMYYYFFYKTPQMMFKRALMILSFSFEYEKGHNHEIVERPSDNIEVPALIKSIPNFGDKMKEKPFCYPHCIKARALFHAHLARLSLNEDTLDSDRLLVVKMAPNLINEMITCISQLIMMAYGGKISHIPSLDTLENTMKLSPHIVQAICEGKSSLLQLPYVKEDILRYFVSKKRPIKTIHQFVSLSIEERQSILRHLSDSEFEDVLKVCSSFPHIDMNFLIEVVDDDDSGVFTAGAIVTVTVLMKRSPLEEFLEGATRDLHRHHEVLEEDSLKDKDGASNKCEKESSSGWKNKQVNKKGKANKKKQQTTSSSKSKKEEKDKQSNKEVDKDARNKDKQIDNKDGKNKNAATPKSKKLDSQKVKSKEPKLLNHIEDVEGGESETTDSTASHSDESAADDADTESHRDDKFDSADDDLEWEKFQRGFNKRERALEGKSKISHSVHCPYFTMDKQEYWWVYICDRKRKMLITVPYQVTSLVEEEEVQLKFTAPMQPGHYTYQLCLKSDSYLGFDLFKDIKLDVLEAREIPTAHPQWDEFSSEEEGDLSDDDGVVANGKESDFATDSDVSFDESDFSD